MAAPEFPVNINRFFPYSVYNFALIMDGRVVAGISKISALKRTTDVIQHRDGNDFNTKRKSPGVSSFDAITLERGVTYDKDFEEWAGKVWSTNGAASGTVSLRDFRKDIIIQLLNEQGTVAKAYKVYNCWVSEYQALPEMDANGNAVAIELIKLENEGWERDDTVVEQQELSFP